MKIKLLAMVSIALLAVPAVAAQPTTTVGAGTSVMCIAEAQDPNADLNTSVKDCSEALKYETMTMEIRVATLTNRGILEARMSDFKGALADYDEALSMDTNSAPAYLNRSATLIGLKRYGDAKNDADKAIAMHATPLEVGYFNRAVANEGLGNIKAAYEDYKAALAVQPNFQPASDELKRFKVVKSGGNT